MKFVHTADLHIGKKLDGISLFDDQKHILEQIAGIIREEKPDCVLIAGDIYDKGIPDTDSVKLFDDFLKELNGQGVAVCAISGNHDSAVRVGFGASFMRNSRVHISESFAGSEKIRPVTLSDGSGPVNIYLLPFVRPADVRFAYPEETDKIKSYHDALACVVGKLALDRNARNVLVAHQFVTGAALGGSETVTIGGLDNVGSEVFAGFDYVALGHVHRRQDVHGDPRLHYAGAPLQYAADEAAVDAAGGSGKSLTVVELGEKGKKPKTRPVELKPLRVVRRKSGTCAELTGKGCLDNLPEGTDKDFYYIELEDGQEVTDAALKLRGAYPNFVRFKYKYSERVYGNTAAAAQANAGKSPLELAKDFFAFKKGKELTDEQEKFFAEIIKELEEQA